MKSIMELKEAEGPRTELEPEYEELEENRKEQGLKQSGHRDRI